MKKFQKKQISAFLIVGIMCISLLVTGTFAWQSIRQRASNKFEEDITPGARLHDDFNGLLNKDVYVENYTSLNDNVPIYARVQLKEYMEIGSDAGNFEKEDRSVTILGSTEDHKIEYNDIDTWHTHEYKPTSALDLEFREYWGWELGNDQDTEEKYYMPTFNKNNQNLDSDINGTLEGSDNDKTQGTPYDDYVVYREGQTKTGKEEYYDPTNPTVPIQKDAIHTAQKIEDKAKVVSMQEWIALGKPIGEYWVYDSDGWAYYAKPIESGKASGLLLNKVNAKKKSDDRYHYSIEAIGEFATAGDWGGFENITTEGRDLLDTIADLKPKTISITPKENKYHQAVKIGNSLTLEADVLVQNGTGSPSEKEVVWQMEDESVSNMLTGNVFHPTDENMVGKTYTIMMTSKLTPEVSNKIRVTVLPADVESNEIMIGEDNKQYISFGNNIYKRIEEDGTLSNYISAGNDKLIGNSDDLTNVVEVSPAHETFGKFFLQEGENLYKWMGVDGFLGTSDDQYVASGTGNWPENITDFLADEMRIKTEAGSTENIQVKMGMQTKFIAEVYFRGQLMEDHEVTWSINGQSDANTTISEDGVLSVGANERIDNTIHVIAASKQDPSKLRTSITITVIPLGYEDIPSIEPESETTVRIGTVDYYVLEKNEEKALLWAKQSVHTDYYGKSAFETGEESGYNWNNSIPRKWLNETFYNDTNYIPTDIKGKIIETTLYSRFYDNSDNANIIESINHIFLLSYEDIEGLDGDLPDERLYTGNGQFIKIKDLIPTDATWLRTNGVKSPGNSNGWTAYTIWKNDDFHINKTVGKNLSRAIRPSFWIKLPTSTDAP
ncbi:MAG: hypothetical protein K2L08_04925 [Erysipelotrichaceae bacterium]|nr:hypothetical protein [Erysipelotrichaceae bacterium]